MGHRTLRRAATGDHELARWVNALHLYLPHFSFAQGVWQSHVTRWSLTIPVACMKA